MNHQYERKLRSKMLGAMLRRARTERGKSLKQTAALIGISPDRLSAFERGRSTIPLPELELLAYQLEIPLKYFLNPDAKLEQRRMDIDPSMIIPLRQRMIGALLRTHRQEAKLSIRKLGKRINISPSRLSAYERGTRPIPLDELEALCLLLGRAVDEYIDRDGPIGDWQRRIQAFELLSKLSPELREFLSKSVNEPYLRLAKQLSELQADKLRTVAEGLLEITL
jgi:transcriptional regulator with XRE-family HTH domain